MKLKYFDLARQLSEKSDHHTYKIGCVIVRKNRIIGMGCNKMKTHVASPHKWKHIHAEFDAILSTRNKEDLVGASVYVFRARKDGTNAISKPCPSCKNMLQSVGVSDIFYTEDGGYGKI